MSNFPDFSSHGYQIVRELGQNRAGGRVTYLATKTKNQLPVVIKQFQFAQLGASWSDYDAYEQEIQLLRRLNHPSIPWYLDSLETASGFCLVQEYIPAPSLAEPRYFTPEEIKQIAVAVLEVLVYLQQQVPQVIHRDIKPENILVNSHLLPDNSQELKVYLVDFGFARMGGGEVAVSSVVKGTLGFMPPEQLFNRQLTEASDLYGLGATVICLLTGTKSSQIGSLIDEAYRIKFKHLVPKKLNPQFLDWLEKMVAPNPKNRYSNAATALKALQAIDVSSEETPLKKFVRATKLGRKASVLGLASLGFAALLGSTLTVLRNGQPENVSYNVKKLLETHECSGCNLRGADLRGVDLVGANLEDADLTGANLATANLKASNLKDAKLKGADLTIVDLAGANLEDADFERANLEGANLEGADIEDADFENANLTGANLTGTNLWGHQIKGANLRGARMPNGLVLPRNWRTRERLYIPR